jgi:hypothetical protein
LIRNAKHIALDRVSVCVCVRFCVSIAPRDSTRVSVGVKRDLLVSKETY